MFTGLVQGLGQIVAVDRSEDGVLERKLKRTQAVSPCGPNPNGKGYNVR